MHRWVFFTRGSFFIGGSFFSPPDKIKNRSGQFLRSSSSEPLSENFNIFLTFYVKNYSEVCIKQNLIIMSVKKNTTLPKSIEIYLEKKKSPSIIQDNTGYYRTIKSVKQ